MNKINLAEKFGLFTEHWTPRIVGEANGQYVKLAKAQGEICWHKHDHEDELFLVVQGTLIIHFRDRIVSLEAGELLIVPRGIEHKTSAVSEAHFMMIEPTTTAHTGHIQSELTVPTAQQVWI